MCNAANHSYDCTCGFGGDGHLGGNWSGVGYGGYSGSVPAWRAGRSSLAWLPSSGSTSSGVRVYLSYRRSMCDLARELGYSIIFPTDCRYCGQPIFLFSSPEGGFTIFDELGIPWPKHECWGVRRGARDYRGNYDYTGLYRLPITQSAESPSRPYGDHITGICLGHESKKTTESYFLWTGSKVVRICSSQPLQPYRFYIGGLARLDMHYWIESPVLIEHRVSSVADFQTGKDDWDVNEVWYLQQDIAELNKSEGEVKELLDAAIEGLVTDHNFVASLVLLKLSRTCSFTLTQEKKSFYYELAVRIISSHGLKYLTFGISRGHLDELKEGVARVDGLLEASSGFIEKLQQTHRINFDEIRSSAVGKLVVQSSD